MPYLESMSEEDKQIIEQTITALEEFASVIAETVIPKLGNIGDVCLLAAAVLKTHVGLDGEKDETGRLAKILEGESGTGGAKSGTDGTEKGTDQE